MKIETPDKEVLNKAKMANFNRVAKTAPAKNWVDWLVEQTLAYEEQHHPRTRARKKDDLERFKAAIGALGADLLRHNGHEDAKGFMYRPIDHVELSYTLVSSDSFGKLIKYWSGLGWLEMTGHIKATDHWEGEGIPGYARARRYRATDVLIDAAGSFQLKPDTVTDNFEISHKHADLVQARCTSKTVYGDKVGGKHVRLKGPKADHQVEIMQRLNQALQGHTYSLREPPTMRRLFNCADRDDFDFNLGGRFYCLSSDNWMQMKPDKRANITIDGEATCEIDVSASHLFILYAMHRERLDYSSDPYTIPGYDRDVIKRMIVAMIGAGKPPKKWPKDFKDDYTKAHGHPPNDDYKLKDLVAAILQKHPVLEKLKPNRLDWANLQFEEAECFLSAMMGLHEDHDIPSLPVHDSLIVRESDREVAQEFLEQAYEHRFGFSPKIKLS